MHDRALSRRRVLASLTAAGGIALSGCLTLPEGDADVTPATPTPNAPNDRSTPAIPATESEARFNEIYENTIDSVSMIQAYSHDQPLGQGSGFVYDGRYLLTNEHVIRGAEQVDLQFRGNRWATGIVAGADPYSDLAIVDADELPDRSEPLPSSETRATVGQEVLALGNPFGLEESVSHGIVSGRNRSLPTGTGFRIPATIQTDASVNPGNSGGPLVTMRSRFLGVITARAGQDIGFAVSWRLVERVAPALIEDGEYHHPYVGIQSMPVTPAVAEANDLDEPKGVIIVDVLDGGPAQGHLQGMDRETTVRGVPVPVGGDVIIQLDDQDIDTDERLSTYLALNKSPHDDLEVTVLREGEREVESFSLGRRPIL